MGDTSRPEIPRRQLFGRRIGKPLNPAERERLETLLPAIRVPVSGPIDPPTLFDRPMKDLWLEVGFGAGEHLAHRAAEYPDIGFIGCEPFVNGAAKLLRRIEDGKLSNIRIHDGDAWDVFDLLPENCLGRVFVLYPDPWPKRRHWKRRFIQPDTLTTLARLTRPGAELNIASDIPDYILWCLQCLMACDDFDWTAESCVDWRTPFADWSETRYEAKALREGRVPTYLRFARATRESA